MCTFIVFVCARAVHVSMCACACVRACVRMHIRPEKENARNCPSKRGPECTSSISTSKFCGHTCKAIHKGHNIAGASPVYPPGQQAQRKATSFQAGFFLLRSGTVDNRNGATQASWASAADVGPPWPLGPRLLICRARPGDQDQGGLQVVHTRLVTRAASTILGFMNRQVGTWPGARHGRL